MDPYTLWAKHHYRGVGTGDTNVGVMFPKSQPPITISRFRLIIFSSPPRIGWPLDADQPANAAHITLNLDIAFEMIEVRTGPGLKPLHRGGRPTGTIEAVISEVRSVLQRARGPEGDRKRRNAESMGEKWKKEWEEGGDARMNLKKFLTDNYPPIDDITSN